MLVQQSGESHAEVRKRLKDDVEAFLEAGGIIQPLPGFTWGERRSGVRSIESEIDEVIEHEDECF